MTRGHWFETQTKYGAIKIGNAWSLGESWHQLRSWSHGSWIRALKQVPCGQCGTCLGFSLSLSLSVPLQLVHVSPGPHLKINKLEKIGNAIWATIKVSCSGQTIIVIFRGNICKMKHIWKNRKTKSHVIWEILTEFSKQTSLNQTKTCSKSMKYTDAFLVVFENIKENGYGVTVESA